MPRPRQSYNVLTSEGMDPSMDRAHGERRHIIDARESRASGMYADAPGGRLRDADAYADPHRSGVSLRDSQILLPRPSA